MGVLADLRRLLTRLGRAEPYHYECTVCGRSFPAERPTCPNCGGDVERTAGETTRVDPGP
jgi:rRNA maturation endonuclease Nob1